MDTGSGAEALLIYGATGYIGDLTVDAALERGLRPRLGGRDAGRVARRAEHAGLASAAAALDDTRALDRMLADVKVLLNAAGPFSETWRPLVDACVRTGVHYLDLTAEVLVFEGIRTCGAAARQRGIMLLPGVGFDVVPSDCLAAHVAGRLPGAHTLRVGVSGLELMSRGSAKTLANQAGRPAFVRRGGQLTTIPAGSLEHTFDFGSGPSSGIAVSWGDLATAFDTTGIPNIETYFEATPQIRTMVAAERLLGPLFSTMPARTLMAAFSSSIPPGPDEEERATRAAAIVIEAEHPSGYTVRSRLRTPEAYTLSARTAAAIAADVLAGNYEPGYQTPARLLGADYVLRFDGVSREDLASEGERVAAATGKGYVH